MTDVSAQMDCNILRNGRPTFDSDLTDLCIVVVSGTWTTVSIQLYCAAVSSLHLPLTAGLTDTYCPYFFLQISFQVFWPFSTSVALWFYFCSCSVMVSSLLLSLCPSQLYFLV